MNIFSISDFMVLIILVLLVILLYNLLTFQNDFFSKRGIPFIKPNLFFGNLFKYFLNLENTDAILWDYYMIFESEKLFGVFNFLRPEIIVKNLEVAKLITIEHQEKFINRDSCYMNVIFSKSIFSLNGNEWRRSRKLIDKYFLEVKVKNWHQMHCTKSAKKCLELLTELDHESIRKSFEIYLIELVFLIILGLDSSHDVKMQILDVLKKFEKDATSIKGRLQLTCAALMPKISKLLRINDIHRENFKSFSNILRPIISSRQVNEKSLLYYILYNRHQKLDSSDIVLECLPFIFNLFIFLPKLFKICYIELIRNQDARRELTEEILQNDTSHKALTVINSFIFECLRKSPLVWNIYRVCHEDCIIVTRNGDRLKFYSGDLIKIPIKLLNRDKKVFCDPNEFILKRFNCERVPNLSFGLGSRSCLCAEFSLLMIRCIIVQILRKPFLYKVNDHFYVPNKFY